MICRGSSISLTRQTLSVCGYLKSCYRPGQVATVIPYFERFMASFPTVQDLAKRIWEQVAGHWAGLGYYARARNHHKGAKRLVDIIEQTGKFPQTVAHWEQISGVGQSTAGAIVAMGVRADQYGGDGGDLRW